MSQFGYEDTPLIPGSKYKVHDSARPQPRIVTPGAAETNGPPSDAVVLFDGTDLAGWVGRDNQPAAWKVENGYMEVEPGSGNIQTWTQFGDCQLHLEWSADPANERDGQGRSNSGVFMLGKYEIQVLDCYLNPTYSDGTTAAIYGQCAPLVNACRPPGQWQSYDIVWIGPRFEGEKLVSSARLTVFVNGILVHHDTTLIGPTAHRTVDPYKAHPVEGPLELQDHSDRVRFRNIWYRPLTGYDGV